MSNAMTPASQIIAQNRQTSLTNQLDTSIREGADKKAVSNAISHAVNNGAITKSEAQSLRNTYTRHGYTY
jgi:hypothetical protein